MRILVTLPWGERLGGAESMLQRILEGPQASERIELVFFQDGPWPRELRDAGFTVDVVPTGRVREAHRGAAAVRRLAALLRRSAPDVLLNWMPKTQIYGAPAAVLAGVSDRTVWWQHGISTGHWTDRLATALPAVAVGCSSQAAARAQEQLRPRRRTFVVEPGTPAPPPGEGRAELDLPEGEAVVGILGRLQPWKGQDRLLRAQALLRERGVPFHLLIVGGDAYGLSPEYARSLPGLVGELGLEGSVTMTGHVEDPGPWVRRMDVLANASEEEPFGIVLLEAMARGVPVVAVGAGGPAEVVRDGVTGALARAGDPQALADALEPLLRSPETRARMASEALASHGAHYTDEAMRERFYAAMADVVALRSGPRAGAGRRRTPRGAIHAPQEQPGVPPVTIVAHDVGSVGGMERQLSELALGLRGLGHEVTVIARKCVLPAEADVEVRIVRVPRRPFLLYYLWFLVSGSIAVARHRRGIVQATGAIVLNRVDAISVHACQQVYSRAPAARGGPLGAYEALVAAVKRFVERLCFARNRAASFVCVSDGVAEEVRECFPDLRDRVLTIHNGVDTSAFAPGMRASEAAELRTHLGLGEGRPVLAFVGGNWEHKGLGLLMRALADAPQWDLVVAGRGEEARERARAEGLGVAGRVHFLGVVEDIQTVYELADAFALPSRYETFSLVTFEAASYALPILATRVSGVSELLEDGRNGYLVEADAAEIAARLRQLAGDAMLRERLGAAARQSALAYSWEAMVRAHHELFEQIAAHGRDKRATP